MSGSDVCGEGHPTYPVMHMMYLPRMDRQTAVKTLLPATSFVSRYLTGCNSLVVSGGAILFVTTA